MRLQVGDGEEALGLEAPSKLIRLPPNMLKVGELISPLHTPERRSLPLSG